MSQLPIIDNLLYNVQRQGKISFYVSRYTYQQINQTSRTETIHGGSLDDSRMSFLLLLYVVVRFNEVSALTVW